jgi:hypothetical protein
MSAATDIASGSDGTLGDRTSCPTSRLIRRSSSLLWGVSDVALRAFELRRERVILGGVYDAAGSDVSHVTCVYPLVAALLSSEPRPELHVSDMSPTQKPLMARAYPKWT